VRYFTKPISEKKSGFFLDESMRLGDDDAKEAKVQKNVFSLSCQLRKSFFSEMIGRSISSFGIESEFV